MTTIEQLGRSLRRRLRAAGVEADAFEADVLLTDCLGLTRARRLAERDTPIERLCTPAQCALLEQAAARRERGEPLPVSYTHLDVYKRQVLASARIPRFDWSAGDLFSAELWLLNDQPAPVEDVPVEAELCLAGRVYPLLKWRASADAGENRLGPTVHFRLPAADADDMTLVLRSREGCDSAYRLCYRRPAPPAPSRRLNV